MLGTWLTYLFWLVGSWAIIGGSVYGSPNGRKIQAEDESGSVVDGAICSAHVQGQSVPEVVT